MRRRNNGDGEERKGPTEYPERDPFDLIDEDKRPYARRKLTATCCGGFRTVYDEVTAKSVHPALFALQILIYLFFPGMILVFGISVWSDKDMRMEACTVVAGFALVVCGSLHGLSFYKQRQNLAT